MMLDPVYSGMVPEVSTSIKGNNLNRLNRNLSISATLAIKNLLSPASKPSSHVYLSSPTSSALEPISRSQPRPPIKMRRRDREPSESLSVPLACVVCRERHVKCDGKQPACSRCLDSKQKCYYVQSRRGRRPSRRRDQSQESSGSSSTTNRRRSSTLTVPTDMDISPFPSAQQQRSSIYALPLGSMPSPGNGLQASAAFQRTMSMSPNPNAQHIPGPPAVSQGAQSTNLLQDFYYFYFHDNHPILVPQLYLTQISQLVMPPVVEAAMYYIGSLYSNVARRDEQYLQRLRECLYAPGAERTRFTVQALILLGIAQRGQHQNDLALDTFDQAIDLSVQLGMNRAVFAQENCEGSVIIQEMWRRVWWELYINDAILAEVRESSYFRLASIESDVALPWEEANYRHCTPSVSHSMRELESTAFGEEDIVFSSFSYRIMAARILVAQLKLNQAYCPNSDELVASVDYALRNWQLHLPDRKKTPVDSEGAIDGMMFQAHLMINSSTINLHRPLSNLIFNSIRDASTVTPGQRNALPAAKHGTHTARAIQAADNISNLLTLLGNTTKDSPLSLSAITLGAVVHLSAYVMSDDLSRSALIKDRILLSTGVLKGMRTWLLADEVLQQLKVAAKEVMTYGHQQPGIQTAMSSNIGYDTRGITGDSWMSAMQDPLFSHQVPDLMPDQQSVTESMDLSIPTIPYTQ